MHLENLSPEQVKALVPTGVLRAVINLGNPVLAQGDARRPTGITVLLAQEMAAWLNCALELVCVNAARDAYSVMAQRGADVCFLADEPGRREHVAFTPPYVVLEGVYATGRLAPFEDSTEVDREGVRIAVRRGSAYDLYLTRTTKNAQIIRADRETDAYEEQGLEVVAGVRQPLTAYAESSGHRILEPAFMSIQQSLGLPQGTADEVVVLVADWLEHVKSNAQVRKGLEGIGAAV